MSGVSTTLLMISSCLICRRKAKGRSCRWPANTGKNSRVALVTGASSGIGFAVTQQLVEHGWRVVMAGRSEERLLEARKKIMVRNPAGCAIVVGVLDLSDLSSVRDFAEVVTGQKDQLSLSLLVNAAGVLRRRLHRCDGTGMEEMIATNVVGPMLLTELLLPLLDETALRTGASSRIVNIASSCHTFLGVAPQQGPLEMLKELHSRAPLSEDAGVRDFTLWNFVGYYGLSKLCMIWWTNILAQRVSSLYLPTTEGAQPSQPLPRVSVACCHPGIITTHLYRDLFPTFVLDYLIYYPSLLIGKTWTDGAQVVLRMAVEEERLVQGGYYLCDGEYGEKSSNCCLSAYAKDMKAAEEFCAWANMQIELQKDTPRVPKLRTKKGMTSLPSPALEEKRQQEHGAFLPPQFSVPMRAPVDGFPSEKDVIVPEVIRLCSKSSDGTGNARVYHGKEMLLNASPTLELPAEDAEALLTALRRHPRCAEIREELKGVNESYLEEAFGEEDAREDDTRRRVDYNAALAIMKSNSSKRLSMCTSCLTRGQHRHYYSWVKRYLEEGIIPNPTEDYPDLSTVIDLVQREQAAYRHKLKEEMIACEACKCETGYNKRTRSDEMPQQSHRACWNHNYIDEYVEQYAKQWLRYRLESQLLRGLLGGSSCGGGGGGVNFSEVICDLRKSIAASTGVKPTATLCERTRHLCAHRVAETIEERQSKGLTRVLPSAAVPPTLPLGVQWLNEREPALHTSNVAGAKVVEKDVSSQGQQQQEVAEARPPALPCKDIVGTFFTLRVCKSALFKLATAHLSSFRGEFCIPVSCTWSPSAQCLDISIEKPLPPSCESRRNISAMAMKRLVDAELRLPTRGRCSGPDGGESKCYSEVSFGADLAFLCMTNCVFDLKEPKPVFRLVKMEYNCKGYNTAPDDERTLLYENFSKKEVIYMWVLLHCNPTAALYVYRVNAYSSAVVGIEQFSSATLANQVLHEYSNDTEVQSAWSCLRDILSKLVATATRQYHQRERQHQEGMDEKSGNPEGCTFLLRKAKGHSEVSLCSVSSCYPTEPSVQDAVESFIEPAGQSVCRREYLSPCVWPFPDRIPFTYGPAPRACYTVNRTTEQRHNSEYYAKNDVWEHNLRYYTVGADGILWEQHLADGP